MASQGLNPSPLEIILETGEDNSGGRRRNRSRVSCVNCYVSKRKCDRERPCTRCTKLGLTGLCVYELEDPSHGKKPGDQTGHLKKRIAELESALRQLERRPHPSWTAAGGVAHDPKLVAARRRSHKRSQADVIRPSSVETFLAATADSSDEKTAGKKSTFVPEFTPSELEYPDAGTASPNSHSASRLVSDPFTFGGRSESPLLFPPLSSFVQNMLAEGKSASSSKHQGITTNPTSCPTNGSASSGAHGTRHGGSTAEIALRLDSPRLSADFVENHDTEVSSTERSSASPPFPVESAPVKTKGDCQCLKVATLSNPLLHLAITLRTSREALQGFHISASDCDLFRRILELEDHIFSADPPTSDCTLRSPHACESETSGEIPVLEPTAVPSPPGTWMSLDTRQPAPFTLLPLSLPLPPGSPGRSSYFLPTAYRYCADAAQTVGPSAYPE